MLRYLAMSLDIGDKPVRPAADNNDPFPRGDRWTQTARPVSYTHLVVR